MTDVGVRHNLKYNYACSVQVIFCYETLIIVVLTNHFSYIGSPASWLIMGVAKPSRSGSGRWWHIALLSGGSTKLARYDTLIKHGLYDVIHYIMITTRQPRSTSGYCVRSFWVLDMMIDTLLVDFLVQINVSIYLHSRFFYITMY